MRLEVIRQTALRARPADTAETLRFLSPGLVLTAVEFAGEWTKVSEGRDTGWVRARDCRRVADPRAPDIQELAAKRRQAIAMPVGAPAPAVPQSRPGPSFDLHLDKSWIDGADGGRGAMPGLEGLRDLLGGHSKSAYRTSRDEPAPTGPAPTASDAEPEAVPDTVDVSVFGPQTVRAGGECLVQAFLHRLDQAAVAAALAKEADPAAGRRGVRTLATAIARGTRVQIIFDGHGLSSDAAMQELTWRGEPDACQFVVSAPADATGKTFYPRILVLLNSVPVGTVTFALSATPAQAPAQAEGNVIRGDAARRYSYAFLSYSSHDRAEVLKRAQGLKAGHIDFFQDLLSLEPGEEWEQRLYQEIDRCDLFLLFWSSRAKDSPWVIKEVEYALARRKASGGGLPDITPVIIEGPPPPAPPERLSGIHFNDYLIYVLAAVEAQGQPPKPP